jgi:hypothetical protein
MSRLSRFAAIVFLGTAACASAASADPAPASGQTGITQELSAACRTVVTYRWSNGRRIAVRRTSCTPTYARPCRYVTRTHWSNGRRVTVRTRVCG